MNLSLFFSLLIDYIHSLYFCIRVFPIGEALKVPVNISRNVKIGKVYPGCIVLSRPICHNMLYIGHQGYEAVAENQGLINIEKGGKIIVEGKARFGQGVRLWIDEGAVLTIGDNFYCNKNCLFRVYDNVSFGKDVLFGWNIELNTTDGHYVKIGNKEKQNHSPIALGNHIWVASHVILGKGTVLPDDTVVAECSLVNDSFSERNSLIGGIPAKVLRTDVYWCV